MVKFLGQEQAFKILERNNQRRLNPPKEPFSTDEMDYGYDGKLPEFKILNP